MTKPTILSSTPPIDVDLAAALSAEIDNVVAAMLGAVIEEVPAYRTLGPRQSTEVLDILRSGYLIVLRAVTSPEEPVLPDRDAFRRLGVQRASEDLPLPAALRAYRVAMSAGLDFILERFIDRLSPAQVGAISRLTLTLLDWMSEGFLEGYVATADTFAKHGERAAHEFILDILAGRFSSAEAATARLRALEIALPTPMTVLVAGQLGTAPLPADTFRAAHTALSNVASRRLLGTVRRNRCIFVGVPPHDDVARALSNLGLVGGIAPADDLAGVAAAYRLVSGALDVVPASVLEARPLLDESEVRLIAALAGTTTLDADLFVRDALGDLLEPSNAALLDSLAAYLDTGNAVAAAERCHVHPQTMRYRLKRVREITGADLDNGWRRLVLTSAIWATRLRPS